MILHCFESTRRPTATRYGVGLIPPTLWSVGTHALVLATVLSGHAPPPPDDSALMRKVVYLLPMLSAPAPERSEQITWVTAGATGTGARSTPPEVKRPDGLAAPAGDGRAAAVAQPVTAAPDSGETSASFVYMEADLDVPVERDPASAGPVYPEELRLAGVEGEVTAEWVVDTTGLADSVSFRLVEATHPPFANAVRATLPGMRFRPAELQGRLVRQLVRQTFRFAIALPLAAAPADSAAP